MVEAPSRTTKCRLMIKQIVQIASLTLIALLAGTVFGIWRGYNPATLSAMAFIEQQQNAIRGLNVLLPVMGALAMGFTLLAAYIQRNDRYVFYTLLLAVLCMVISMLVTRFGNQPLNAVVMTWRPDAPPATWQELRDKWWHFHLIRTGTTIAALVIMVYSIVQKAAIDEG